MVEDMAKDQGISSLKFSIRKNESVLLQDNDLVTGVSDDEVADYDNDLKTTVNEVCSDSEEAWDKDELQETISDMKSDHVVMNDNEDVEDEDKSDELGEGDDEIGEVEQSEDKKDKVVEDDTLAPRTTRSGKTYAQVVERGIGYSRESGLFLAE